MNIQIFVKKKCRDSQKAERWFSERRVPVQVISLEKKGISQRELESVLRHVSKDDLLDENCKAYKDRGLAWMDFDPVEEAIAQPELLRTPIVRNGRDLASIGYCDGIWAEWLKRED